MMPAALALIGFGVCVVFVKGTRQDLGDLKERDLRLANLAWQLRLDVVQVQQWLTDISATRGFDGLDDGFAEAEVHRRSFLEGLQLLRNELRDDVQFGGHFQDVRRAFENYYEVGVTMATAYVEGGPSRGNATMGEFDSAAEALASSLVPILDGIISRTNSSLD